MKPAQLLSLIAKLFVLAILPISQLSMAKENVITFDDSLQSENGVLLSTVLTTRRTKKLAERLPLLLKIIMLN
ncbi:MAG: hypothetical protein MJK15_14330 [Colwellia sp.]|nr:hypothetical protein [Colwellia sp.]